MKFKNIVILTLIISILLVNSSVICAEEIEEGELQSLETSEESMVETDTSETNTYSVGNLNIDASNYNGYIKPNTSLWDDGNRIYQYDEFASYYFYNLTDNFGYNTHGSCGYVAAAMMLSYYDTYWDDNVIDDQNNYDVDGAISSFDLLNSHSSPGIRREIDSLSPSGVLKGLDCSIYKTVIDSNYEDYFHLYLIKLAESKFNMYHDTVAVLEECGIIWETNSQFPCASAMLHQKSLIEHYLWNVRGYEKSQVFLEYNNTDVRNFTINKLNDGQPVMLFLGNLTEGFHFVVAYDLDDKETEDTSDDDIYAHYGWNKESPTDVVKTHINIDTDTYPLLISAMTITFDENFEHSHSNNYVDSNGNAYCSCYFPCHPEHEHTYEQIEGDASQHKYTCGCVANDVNTAYHSFTTYESVDETYHTKTCADCGYTETEAHDYEDYDSCYEKCTVCGYKKQVAEHEYTQSYTSINESYHYGYCECGAKAQLEHEFTSLSQLLDVCKYCGYDKDHVHEYTYRFCKDGETHIKSCSCGISTIEQCFGTTTPGQATTCIKCGQILNGGIITWSISDEALPYNKEDDEYLEE